MVAAWDRRTLLVRLTERLEEDLHLQLFPSEACDFRSLLGKGQLEEAVRLYDEKVGHKWDPVRLQLDVVEMA